MSTSAQASDYPLTSFLRALVESSPAELWGTWRPLLFEVLLWTVVVFIALFVFGVFAMRVERRASAEPSEYGNALPRELNLRWTFVASIAASVVLALWARRWEAGVFAFLVFHWIWGLQADVRYALDAFTRDIVKQIKLQEHRPPSLGKDLERVTRDE